MAYRSMRALHPAVEHAAREWLLGAPPIHALREATAVGYLMGRGLSPERALREFERLEALPTGAPRGYLGLGVPAYELAEPYGAFHYEAELMDL